MPGRTQDGRAMRLRPPLLGVFLSAIEDSFTADELDALLTVRLGTRQLVIAGVMWSRQVAEVHAYFDRRRDTARFIVALIAERPNEPIFAEAAAAVAAAAPVEDQALAGLSRLAAATETRPLVSAHRAELERAIRYTQQVAALKTLHDLADQLRRSVFVPLRLVVDRFPNAGALMELSQYLSVFGTIQRGLVAASGPPCFGQDEHPWITEHLPIASDQMKAALASRDPSPLQDAIGILKSIVETELSGLDRDLARAAQDLNLETLILQFRRIQDEAAELGASQYEILALERDVTTLETVSVNLATLVREHGAWQRVDTYLNAFENSLNQSAATIATPWRLVETRLRALLDRGTPIEGLSIAVDDMAKAITVGDLYEIILKFPSLSALVRNHFFKLDRDLLNECGRVTSIGDSLRNIVERLDG
jgi:hypothetical protein